ncbi:MAG: amidase family protein [Candidatus Dormibacteraeota bacterium]|uniref:Amidase family protein n=1 Tax=Candidatus Dormiibacter inghamiae TaxID=3127013 RepID=A0A934NBR3_9BACT|nr:amidase family protein [Candidatus Dormibacteraeota bacterium]MBJ7606609.1 amidase family protein [Candidatus Dormibacteraeota bacterium]
MAEELWRWDAVRVARAVRTRAVSSREVVESCLRRLDAVNPALNAVTVVLGEEALAAADSADRAVARGEALGTLHGVPVTIKENVDVAGQATPNGIEAYARLIAPDDSPQVAAWKAAGAIIIGRTNTPAFSLRWDTDNALRGRTCNPWSPAHTPGGSSGGAAASVATGITPLAHGNDYGGSIRYPAYCCGLVGIRPSLGRVPAYNPSAAAERPITGQIMSVQGPLARRVQDVRAGLAAMVRADPRDPWWVPAPLEGPPPRRPIRVAVTADPARLGVNPVVADAVRRAAGWLADAGYAVEEIEPPAVDRVAELWELLVMADTRVMTGPDIEAKGDEGIRRAVGFMLGNRPELDLAGYIRGLAERAGHLRAWSLFSAEHPLVLGPVSTEPPFAVGFDTGEASGMARTLRAQRLLIAVNLLGLPAVAVPTGQAGDLPLGVQIIGPRFREDLCLDAAEVIEARAPSLTPIDPRPG